MYEVRTNPANRCPSRIIDKILPLEISYFSDNSVICDGIMEVHQDVAEDVAAFFALARRLKFPIHKVVPASDPSYMWNDALLMDDDVSSGFNYRKIAGSDNVSLHGLGRAFDINPRRNPYIRYENDKAIVAPTGAIWNPHAPGTLHARHELVTHMKKLGWIWGGDWSPGSGRVDYQHFEKNEERRLPICENKSNK